MLPTTNFTISTKPQTIMSLSSFIRERVVGDVIFDKRGIIEAEASTTLDKVLADLSLHNIRAVPIYKQKHDAGAKTYLGIVTAFDIISLIAFGTQEDDEKKRTFTSDVDYTTTTAEEIVGKLTQENKQVWLFECPDSLYSLCEAFGKGVHRALVRQKDDETGRKALRMVTQTDVIRYLVQHENCLKPLEPQAGASGLPTKKLWNMTMEELGFCCPLGELRGRKILDLTIKDTAIHGFRMMAFSGIQSLPVLDEQKRIVTTLSVADLRSVAREDIKQILYTPVCEYLKGIYGTLNTLHPITCKPRDTLWDVMIKLSAAQIHKHQAWITDADDKVLGVVSLTDILLKIFSAAMQPTTEEPTISSI